MKNIKISWVKEKKTILGHNDLNCLFNNIIYQEPPPPPPEPPPDEPPPEDPPPPLEDPPEELDGLDDIAL